MYKKIPYFIIITLSMFISIKTAYAEDIGISRSDTIDCNYEYFTLRFSSSDKSYYEIVEDAVHYDFTLSKSFKENFKYLRRDKCPVMYKCNVSSVGDDFAGDTTYELYLDELSAGSCSQPVVTEKCSGGSNCDVNYNGGCLTYDIIKGNIKESYDNYKSSKNISYLNKTNQKVDELKELCRDILSFANHDDECLKSCFNLSDELKQIGIITENPDSCGFSDTLLAWIKNIISVIKYIIPVIVIIFGIVDFIKAIASDKDDDMKKAQGRFIKRLIAAALIFIVPFIIEFILDKAGFINDECAIDLGKIGL